ncbi:MAG: SGNH/GDSL hydrolase family protein [Candidatus Omnitrophota bacterium]
MKKINKYINFFMLLLLISLMIALIGYISYGHNLIKSMYEKKSLEILDRIIEYRAILSLEYYLIKGDVYIIFISLCVLFLFLVYILPVEIKLSIISVVMCIAILEIIFLSYDVYLDHEYPEINEQEKMLWEYDPLLGWRWKTNCEKEFIVKRDKIKVKIKRNAKGLRGKDYDYKKNKNINRILILGDSCAAGLEVTHDNLFSTVLEKLLRQHGKDEVINAGVRGYGTDQSYLYLKNKGCNYNPDIAIYLFCSNDPKDNIVFRDPYKPFNKSCYIINKEGDLVLKGMPILIPTRSIQHEKWIMTDKKAELFYNEKKQRTTIFAQAIIDILYQSHLYRWVMLRIEDRIINLRREKIPHFVVKYQWSVTEKLIEKMKNFCTSINAKFIIFEFSNGAAYEKKDETLAAICSNLSVNYHNLYNDFHEASGGKRFFCFPHDNHWNVEGHRFAADRFYEYLLKNKHVAKGILLKSDN